VHQKVLLLVLSLGLPNMVASDDKQRRPYPPGKTQRFVATAYSAGVVTALGEKPVPGLTIAADPKVVPLGSFVEVRGAGRYSGVYRVGDVGGKIKGNIIDVFVRSYDEAIQFGRKVVQVTVLGVPRRKPCYGCGKLDPKAIISVDEARASSSNATRRALPPGRTRNSAGESNSWESGSLAAFRGLPSFEGAPAN
jgi:3D (Asp-Asp-Asp) domain-containing protein